jgi:acetyltransferase-like isoleucine patch superfamily enzyme
MVEMLISYFIKIILMIGGMQIGKGFRIEGFPKIVGKKSNISIGDNVVIMKNVELKTRSEGKIKILDGVKIDNGVRIIAANAATIKLNSFSKVMYCSYVGGGADISLGFKSGISAFCMVNSSVHLFDKDSNFMDQGYEHKEIKIGDDVQVGSHSYVMPGVTISNKVMVSTHSVVQDNIPEFSVVAGIPARLVGSRR